MYPCILTNQTLVSTIVTLQVWTISHAPRYIKSRITTHKPLHISLQPYHTSFVPCAVDTHHGYSCHERFHVSVTTISKLSNNQEPDIIWNSPWYSGEPNHKPFFLPRCAAYIRRQLRVPEYIN